MTDRNVSVSLNGEWRVLEWELKLCACHNVFFVIFCCNFVRHGLGCWTFVATQGWIFASSSPPGMNRAFLPVFNIAVVNWSLISRNMIFFCWNRHIFRNLAYTYRRNWNKGQTNHFLIECFCNITNNHASACSVGGPHFLVTTHSLLAVNRLWGTVQDVFQSEKTDTFFS